MASKKSFIVGNWKMYIASAEEAKKFTAGLRRKLALYKGADIFIAPPFTLLGSVATALKGTVVKVGSQSVSQFLDEKRTGEVSAPMVKAAGATFAIIGHSERRAMGENNAAVRAQIMRAIEQGLTIILCVGETERDQAGAYLSVVTEQLSSALEKLPLLKPGKLVVAYEPVWAIGKSAADAMKAPDVREMSIFIKKTLTEYMERSAALKVPILYGGAVEASNARELLQEGDVQGLLVGHASSNLESFIEILKAVCR
ncbi:MAG TPA: triose-phosphate isomerase [Candidatus Paceibacterota bacterium]|nr:triose-phosphate isomerase [Candidatus Paceibacterota bacterium]